MADKLLFKFELNDELKKTAGSDGDHIYEVREVDGREDVFNVWWDDEGFEYHNRYSRYDVDKAITDGSWIKLDDTK